MKKALGKTGFELLLPAESSSEPIVNAFSVDVEDYYHVSAFEQLCPVSLWGEMESRVESNTVRLLDLLARHKAKATFFVLGWVAERHPALVNEICDRGHELASHGYAHTRVTTMTPADFREDVRRSKGILENMSGVEVLGYRAPSFSIVEETLWALDVLIEEGYQYDSSIFPIRHFQYGFPESPRHPWVKKAARGKILIEFPISTLPLGGRNWPFVGGGYLRQFPLFFAVWALRRFIRKEQRPAVVYVHPWELDPGQPRLSAGWLTRMRHYRNLDSTEKRLEQLLSEFTFSTLREVLRLEMSLQGSAGK